MNPSDHPSSFFSLYDPNPPRPRQPSGTAASIWAPQPQPSGTTWPKALDSFSRVAERDSELCDRPDAHHTVTLPVIGREDVFGPAPALSTARARDVGAIGDGRKKHSPDFEDTVGSPLTIILAFLIFLLSAR